MKYTLKRRHFLTASLATGAALLAGSREPLAAGPLVSAVNRGRWDFEVLKHKARTLAAKRFVPPDDDLPEALEQLSYDAYRDIRFKPEQSLWKNGRLFRAQFFHRGSLYATPVALHVLRDGELVSVPYKAELFDFGQNQLEEPLPEDLGFAGLRLHHPLNRADYFDELAVFLGASYFRVLGRGQAYGISARGLAIDTASPRGEEFPYFKELILEEPAAEQTTLTLYALLDSPSVCGAYRFVFHPGTTTDVEITAQLHFRKDVAKLGLAPLTSMFLYGEEGRRPVDDFRPEVHDSDGLLVRTTRDEWVWRPLGNPKELRVSAFLDDTAKGFGLLQRDRNFDHYQDLEANYHARPSVWIEPRGHWGKGHVELVEIPAEGEIHDNVVAYWVPEQKAKKGSVVDVGYQLRSFLDLPELSPAGRVTATRTGTAAHVGAQKDVPKQARLFVIDFSGGDLPTLLAEQPMQADITASRGTISDVVVQKNGATQGWRVFFTFLPEGSEPADLRCALLLRGARLTETWTYRWSS